MIKFLGQMLKLPVAAVVASVEIIARAMREFQKTFDQSIEIVTSGSDATLGDASSGERSGGNENSEPQTKRGDCTNSEDEDMPDQDLSSDDLKYVSYSILFTKPDYEATLENQRHQLVNYPTSGGSYGGIKIAHFMARLVPTGGGVPRPQVWIVNHYPPQRYRTDDTHWQIPTEDEKYLTFIYEIEQRLPKETSDYDKRQARALEAIQEKL